MKKTVSVLLLILMFVSVFVTVNITVNAASSTSSATYKVKNLKQTKVTTNSFSFSWSKVSGAKYYQIFFSKDSGKTWKTASSKVKRTYATVKSFTSGTKYWFKVRAIVGAKKIKGATSDPLKTQTLCKAPTIKLTAKAEAATASWSKIAGAKTYLIYKSNNNKTWSKAGNTSGLSFTVSGVASGKKIYVKVYAVNAYNKKSSASKAKSIAVKSLESYLPCYADVVNQYQSIIKKKWDTNWYKSHRKSYSYVNDELVYNQSFLTTASPLYYSLYDINKDGIPEMLTKCENIVYDLYTYKGGKAVRLFDLGCRSSINILTNGTVVVSGSGGASVQIWSFYKYKSTSSTPVLMDTLTVESYYGDVYYKGENMETVISYNEAVSIMKKYTGQGDLYFEKLSSEIKPTWKNITSISSGK